MKTRQTVTIIEADRKHPIRRTPIYTSVPAVAGTPVPQTAGSRGTDCGRMSMSEAIALLTDTAMRSALQSRAEPRRAARMTMIAVQGACQDCCIDAQDTISLIARIIVRVTSRLGGNVAAVTMGLGQGVIDSVNSTGISADTALAAAADGALQAAGDEGWSAVGSVRRVVEVFATSRQHQGRSAPRGRHPVASPTQTR